MENLLERNIERSNALGLEVDEPSGANFLPEITHRNSDTKKATYSIKLDKIFLWKPAFEYPQVLDYFVTAELVHKFEADKVNSKDEEFDEKLEDLARSYQELMEIFSVTDGDPRWNEWSKRGLDSSRSLKMASNYDFLSRKMDLERYQEVPDLVFKIFNNFYEENSERVRDNLSIFYDRQTSELSNVDQEVYSKAISLAITEDMQESNALDYVFTRLDDSEVYEGKGDEIRSSLEEKRRQYRSMRDRGRSQKECVESLVNEFEDLVEQNL